LFNSDCFNNAKQVPIYLFAEGYAANFATSIAYYNAKERMLNLKGLIVMGGLLDPVTVIGELGYYLYKNKLINSLQRMQVERQILLIRDLY
jgi:carboxypeptidase C (cathepsin A)